MPLVTMYNVSGSLPVAMPFVLSFLRGRVGGMGMMVQGIEDGGNASRWVGGGQA